MSTTNLFGTFLDTFSKESRAPARPPAPGQHVDAILKALHASASPLTLAQLMPAAEYSAAALLDAVAALQSKGLIERAGEDSVQLTALGRQIAALTR
jgi:predicted transcriptional regulator